MKRKRIIYLDEDGTQELDRLVSDELCAVEKKLRRTSKRSPESWKDEPYGDDFEKRESVSEPKRVSPPKTEIPKRNLERHKVIDIHKAKKNNQIKRKTPEQWDDAGPEFEVDLDYRDKVLFDSEEEEFIDKAIEFLKNRDNKDIIISRIWNLLTEIEPESFYSPEPEETNTFDREKPSVQTDVPEETDKSENDEEEPPEQSE